ncbi:MAG TPA: hypothetical protein VES67_24940 [Vicinamibacterales bacterium]|nr:hypothetical protein [Vicinamibacterales bacterium]
MTRLIQEPRLCGVVLAVLATCACEQPAAHPSEGGATPVYNKQTGRLEQLLSDKNGDGKIDTRAHMDGVRLKMIEIDLNGDERPDRWEYYVPASKDLKQPSPPSATVIERVEEAAQPNGRITRREFYVDGVIQRSEEDTDLDGRIDKWEVYEHGQLTRVDLDLLGKGFATRRLVYHDNGTFDRVEEDPDGDGKFDVVPPAKKGGESR